ncbi:MAG: DEAD/DEAH box helicase [Thermodesulfobacteriota bacterium]|nr:DEAD/DEAH box helicase [Thermodesulfobacteriota bacterium]
MRFTELEVPDEVQQGVVAQGFEELTPVQEQSIPLALDGKDVAAQAQTGTGKTAAFLIALFIRLLKNRKNTGANPRALIMAPTRELVVQICEDAKGLGGACPLKILPVFGGVDYERQRKALLNGVDVIVATPGRLIDYAKQKVFSFKQIEVLVIDEADRMFDMGFISDLRYILRCLPSFDNRQTMLFSATLSPRVMELAYDFMNDAVKVQIEPEQVTAERVEQIVYHVGRKEKLPLLLGLLDERMAGGRVMVFANTKRETEYVTLVLQANNYKAAQISGDISQAKRMRILQEFKDGKLNILVATDVASRGIHINDVTHVVNYDVPEDPEDYVHRIGRTARAGASGLAITMADENLVFHLPAVEDFIGAKIPSEIPEESMFCWKYQRPRIKKKTPPHRKAPKGKPASSRPRRRKPTSPSGKNS